MILDNINKKKSIFDQLVSNEVQMAHKTAFRKSSNASCQGENSD